MINRKVGVHLWPAKEFWDYEHVTNAYKEDPGLSKERIFAKAMEMFPGGSDADFRRVL